LAIAGAGKNHVFHARATQGLGGLLAQNPGDSVGDVGFAATIGTNDGRDPITVEFQLGAVAEGLEAENLQLFQFEQLPLLRHPILREKRRTALSSTHNVIEFLKDELGRRKGESARAALAYPRRWSDATIEMHDRDATNTIEMLYRRGGSLSSGHEDKRSRRTPTTPSSCKSASWPNGRREEQMNNSINASDTRAATEPESMQFGTNRLPPAQRWLSLVELAVGSVIVIGHNVYHVIPNEVPILVVLALISFRLRGGGWTATGLRWTVSWPRTAVFALAA